MPAGDVVLLVNDIPDHAVTYGRTLAQHGFAVHLVRSGKEALDLMQHTQPHCVVIDLRLPDMSGWDLCRQIKSRRGAQDTPIVVLTPDLSKVCAENSAKVGCDAWLAHPTIAEDLVRTVKHVLDLESVSPESIEEAVLGLVECPACGSDAVRPTLRISPIQYYCCRKCGFCWRLEMLQPAQR
jgi:CheY-like chemotaxis protein